MKDKLGPITRPRYGAWTAWPIATPPSAGTATSSRLREETLALWKARFGPDHPNTLASMQNLIELLANCPDVKLRDPKRAVELAMKAVELAPRSGWSWHVLGCGALPERSMERQHR